MFTSLGDHGLFRAFSFLALHDYAWIMSTNDFTLPYLQSFDIVFINLVHSECPDFDSREKQALLDYVAWGGSVLFLAEHTNVYRHAERYQFPILPPSRLTF